MQALLPKVRRFRLPSRDRSTLAFKGVEARRDKFNADALYDQMFDVIKAATETLAQDSALSSSDFGERHPFACANVLRTLSPTRFPGADTCWEAMWITLFYINTLGYMSRAQHSHSFSDCPPSAYVTSKCLDALESVLRVTSTRRRNFDSILSLLLQLFDVEDEKNIATLVSDGLTLQHANNKSDDELRNILTSGYTYRIATILDQLIWRIEEYEWSSAISETFAEWRKNIAKCIDERKESLRNRVEVGQSSEPEDQNEQRMTAKILQILGTAMEKTLAKDDNILTRHPKSEQLKSVQQVRQRIIAIPEGSGFRRELEEGVQHTIQQTNKFKGYFEDIHNCYREVSLRVRAEDFEPDQVLKELVKLGETTLNQFDEELANEFQGAVKFAEATLNEQLAFEQSGQTSKFDVAELAHALRVVCRFGEPMDFGLIKLALDTVSRWQRDDGTWPAQRPFFFVSSGLTAHPHSIEIAWAMVSVMKTIISNADRFGIPEEEVAAHFRLPYASLQKFFGWLNGAAVRFRRPDAPHQLFGWCSDRTAQPASIHPWATANAVEFLIEYRDLLQHRINNAILSRFQSYHPANLHKLDNVDPTDLRKISANGGNLGTGEESNTPITTQIRDILRDPARLHMLESSFFFNSRISRIEPEKLSLILYGPPGTSKTYLAEAIAGELGWPLVSLSPSDFLAGGEANVETRAREIFDALRHGSHLVYLFDEIDELILDREIQKSQSRTVFSFLTPSFLTKLQDLRKAAKQQQFISIVGTNYFERIDSAARRPGRVDASLLVLYPDLESRAGIVMRYVVEKAMEECARDQGGEAEEGRIVKTICDRYKQNDLLVHLIRLTALMQFIKFKDIVKRAWKNEVVMRESIGSGGAEISAMRERIGIKTEDHEVDLAWYIDRPKAEKEFEALVNLLQAHKGRRDPRLDVGVEYHDLLDKVGEKFALRATDQSKDPIMDVGRARTILGPHWREAASRAASAPTPDTGAPPAR